MPDHLRSLEPFGGQDTFDQGKRRIHDKRERTGGNGPEQYEIHIVGVQPEVDHPSQSARARERTDGDSAHGSDRGNAHAAHDGGDGQGMPRADSISDWSTEVMPI